MMKMLRFFNDLKYELHRYTAVTAHSVCACVVFLAPRAPALVAFLYPFLSFSADGRRARHTQLNASRSVFMIVTKVTGALSPSLSLSPSLPPLKEGRTKHANVCVVKKGGKGPGFPGGRFSNCNRQVNCGKTYALFVGFVFYYYFSKKIL